MNGIIVFKKYGKCPIQQYDHCEFVKSKSSRQEVLGLLVTCHRQYDLKQRQLREWIKSREKEECENECNYKGKRSEMKDHLDNSYRLISTQKIMLLIKNLQSQLQAEKLQTRNIKKKKKEELRKMYLKSNAKIEKLKESDNKKI
ncbi:hypothetical protein RFI_05867 [Reticulomyxa filosa]|uniref:Uncharacterized protein n=1 Tax=Reticulomyxa filosa TaxID=46433 RepID=X6NZE4_RETFI|nr:hypothetical protein RFI_05867 [Reticulomyxa filosa]|eukprot:ETO31253.1 hypothetical protein RFI_05867 [Reticulomyxa filosa]